MVVFIAFFIQFVPPDTSLAQYRFLENGSPIRRGIDTGYLVDTPTRLKIDLSGEWSYSITGGPTGVVRIPAAYDFTGEVVFERSFEIDSSALDKYQFHLVMLGANYATSVTVNRDFIASHFGGSTSFTAPIPTHVLQLGLENIIRVTTDNTLDGTKTLPLRSQVWGWKNYGGILRDIYILGTPKIFLSDVAATSELNKDFTSAKMRVTGTLESDLPSVDDTLATRFQFSVELFDTQTGELVATSPVVPIVREEKKWKEARVELTVPKPRLWSPETPDRYSVRAYVIDASTRTRVDEYYFNTGIRKVEVSGKGIFLNGARLILNGIVWIEDHPEYGNALPWEIMEKDIALIRSVGANAVRFGFHPPHPYMLNLCDRYGLLALVELPVRNVPASILAGEHYIELAGNRLRELLLRDRNHPSVLAWGLGDDFEVSSSATRPFVESLAALARSLDGRPLYYGLRYGARDTCSDLVDLTAVTVMTRDVKQFRRELDSLHAAHSDRPVLVAGMGCEVQPDNRNGYSDPLSYEAQARYMLQHVDAVRASNVDGAFIWSFNDWRGDRPSLTVKSGNPWMHTLGIVTYAREKRLAYDALRAAFRGEKFSALPMGSTRTSSPVIYVFSGLLLLIGTAYLYNANRRFREALNRSMVNAYNFFTDVRDQRIVTFMHSTLIGLIVSAATAIVLSSLLYHFRNNLFLDNLLSFLLVSDRLKEICVRLILEPREFIPVFTGVFFLMLVVTGLCVWIVAPLFKARIYPFHSYAMTMWSTPPLLVLVPLGMILFRLIESPVYILPSVILIVILFLWVGMRFLKGLAIVYDIYPLKVYAFGLVAVAGVLAGAYIYLDQTESASVYMKYLYHDMVHRGR